MSQNDKSFDSAWFPDFLSFTNIRTRKQENLFSWFKLLVMISNYFLEYRELLVIFVSINIFYQFECLNVLGITYSIYALIRHSVFGCLPGFSFKTKMLLTCKKEQFLGSRSDSIYRRICDSCWYFFLCNIYLSILLYMLYVKLQDTINYII